MREGKWWDGKRWRASEDGPNTAAEARAYKTALDVLVELNQAMIGDGPVNGAARVAAARRFGRSAEADRDERSASTLAEIEADQIFEAARPYLHKRPLRNRLGFTDEPALRTAWSALARFLSHQRGKGITPNRLRMLCRQRGAK